MVTAFFASKKQNLQGNRESGSDNPWRRVLCQGFAVYIRIRIPGLPDLFYRLYARGGRTLLKSPIGKTSEYHPHKIHIRTGRAPNAGRLGKIHWWPVDLNPQAGP